MNKQVNKILKCKICGKEFPVLATHIIRSHNISPNEYKNRYPGSKLTSDEHRKKISLSAKARFVKNPELRKKVATRTFDFINNEDLKYLLQRDYQTAKKCLKNNLWKPAIILYGSLIEAILREDTRTENFNTALKKALEKEIISETEFHQIHVVRNSRNFVHLHKELLENIKIINDYWAKALADICESLIQRLKNKRL